MEKITEKPRKSTKPKLSEDKNKNHPNVKATKVKGTEESRTHRRNHNNGLRRTQKHHKKGAARYYF